MREHWALGEDFLPEKEPSYEPAAEHGFKVKRPATDTNDIPFTCPKCQKELTLQAKSRQYVWRRRWPWLAGTVALYSALATVVVALGVGKAAKPLLGDWGDLAFAAVAVVLILPLARALSGPLEIVNDPGKHELSRVRPLS